MGRKAKLKQLRKLVNLKARGKGDNESIPVKEERILQINQDDSTEEIIKNKVMYVSTGAKREYKVLKKMLKEKKI